MTEGLRLTEALTTSSAVATYLGAHSVTAEHVLTAIGILRGTVPLDDLGRPQSPMLSRATGAGREVDALVREIAQRWFSKLGSDPFAEMDAEQVSELEADLRAATVVGGRRALD